MLLDHDAIQARKRVALRRLCRSGLVVIAVATAVRSGGCGCNAGVPHRPSLVWDGASWVAAWGAPQDGAVYVYVHRFELRSARAASSFANEPERAIRVDALRGTPELAAGPDGFLLFVHRGDRDLLALALDAGGRVKGEPHRAARKVASVCAAPGWSGDHYAAAWVAKQDDGGARLVLAFFDRSGAIARSSGMAVPEGGSCALAVGEHSVALVYTTPRASSVTITSTAAGDLAVDHRQLAAPGARVLRIVANEKGYAVLFRRTDGTAETLQVAEVDRRGRPIRSYDLPGAVVSDTADLGANRRGLFVTWTDARRAWLAGLAGDGSFTHRWYARGGRELSGSRALGRNGQCATAWTSLGGMVVHAAVAPDCPRP